MAYDHFPLKTLEEKKQMLGRAADEGWILFFEHDPEIAAATVRRTGSDGFEITEIVEIGLTRMDDDADLMRRDRPPGDEDAFRALVERHEERAYLLSPSPAASEDAEDLTQELFLALYRAAGRYRPEAPFTAYFYRIASNLAASHLRRSAARPAPSLDEMAERGFDTATGRHEDDPARSFDAREMRRRYEEALARLPPDWRIALELRVGRELSYGEIAAAMGKSVSAVESILVRARERIAEEMREGGWKRDDG